MDIVWLLGDEKLFGKVGEDEGEGLALRNGGNEILFAPIGKTLRWVAITEFSTIEEEAEGEEGAEQPVEEAPFPRRRTR